MTAEGFPLGVPVDIVYLRFDVSSFNGSIVDSATLRLYGQYNAPSMQIAVFSTDGDDCNGGGDGLGDQESSKALISKRLFKPIRFFTSVSGQMS